MGQLSITGQHPLCAVFPVHFEQKLVGQKVGNLWEDEGLYHIWDICCLLGCCLISGQMGPLELFLRLKWEHEVLTSNINSNIMS